MTALHLFNDILDSGVVSFSEFFTDEPFIEVPKGKIDPGSKIEVSAASHYSYYLRQRVELLTDLLQIGENWYGSAVVETKGGFEGGGDEIIRVFCLLEFDHDPSNKKVSTATVVGFVKVTGYYSSYEGSHYDIDGAQEVTPKLVTVVQYS